MVCSTSVKRTKNQERKSSRDLLQLFLLRRLMLFLLVVVLGKGADPYIMCGMGALVILWSVPCQWNRRKTRKTLDGIFSDCFFFFVVVFVVFSDRNSNSSDGRMSMYAGGSPQGRGSSSPVCQQGPVSALTDSGGSDS